MNKNKSSANSPLKCQAWNVISPDLLTFFPENLVPYQDNTQVDDFLDSQHLWQCRNIVRRK